MILQLNHTATISRFQIARRKIRRGTARRLWQLAPGRPKEKDSKIHYFPLTLYFGPCILKTTLALLVAHQYRRLLRWAEIFEIVGLLSFQSISAKIPPCCFSELVPRAISGFKTVGGQTGPPEAVYMEVGSS